MSASSKQQTDFPFPKTVITAEMYFKAVGTTPTANEMEKSNCQEAGKLGHLSCGWCNVCNLPNFLHNPLICGNKG